MSRQPAPRPARRPVTTNTPVEADPFCPRNDDCQRIQAEAAVRAANAQERIAGALESLQPAADTLHDFSDRLEKLCEFFRKKGPWLLASAPLIATIVGAVIPELAPLARAIGTALASQAVPGGEG